MERNKKIDEKCYNLQNWLWHFQSYSHALDAMMKRLFHADSPLMDQFVAQDPMIIFCN